MSRRMVLQPCAPYGPRGIAVRAVPAPRALRGRPRRRDDVPPPSAAVRHAIARAIEGTPVTAAEILGRSRTAPVAHARQRVMLMLREAGWSYWRIAHALGRDHTTVIRGIRAAQARRMAAGAARGPHRAVGAVPRCGGASDDPRPLSGPHSGAAGPLP